MDFMPHAAGVAAAFNLKTYTKILINSVCSSILCNSSATKAQRH